MNTLEQTNTYLIETIIELRKLRDRHMAQLRLKDHALCLIADQAGNPDTHDLDIVRRECYGWAECGLKDIEMETRYEWTRFTPSS